MKHDIIIVATPYRPLEFLPDSQAGLVGYLKSRNVAAYLVDLSLEIHKEMPDKHSDLMLVCSGQNTDPSDIKLLEDFLERWASKLVTLAPTINLNVENINSELAAVMLAKHIRSASADTKIIVSGPGIPEGIHKSIAAEPTDQNFCAVMERLKLADASIYGDEENKLIEFARGSTVEFDVNFQLLDLKDNYAFADYDDLDISAYKSTHGVLQIPLRTSRGCIRNCDFCQFPTLQDKYRFREGKNIAEEVIYLAERYGIREFNFRDIVLNGNMNVLNEWVSLVADYNLQNPEKAISWSSCGWVCRRKGKNNSPEHFDRLAQSGCRSLTIGSETGSNRVLEAMQKGTDVESLEYEIEQMNRVGINYVFTWVHGHWSEHWDDFLLTADQYFKLSPNARLGRLLTMTRNTFSFKHTAAAYRQLDKNKIEHVGKDQWWTPLNPSLTIKERYYRSLILYKMCQYFNYRDTFHDMMEHDHRKVVTDFEAGLEFYREKTHGLELTEQHARHYYYNFDEFLELMRIRHKEETVTIELDLDVSVANNNHPKLEVLLNGNLLGEATESGLHRYEAAAGTSNVLEMRFSGKGADGTVVDQEGNIVADTYISFNKLEINGIDLFADKILYAKQQYTIDNQEAATEPGFYMNNSKLVINFSNPFFEWYAVNSKENILMDTLNITEHTPVHRYDLNDEHYLNEIINMLEQHER